MRAPMNDHARLCQGREYTCTCGYDTQRDAELTRLHAEKAALREQVEKAREALKRIARGTYDGLDVHHFRAKECRDIARRALRDKDTG